MTSISRNLDADAHDKNIMFNARSTTATVTDGYHKSKDTRMHTVDTSSGSPRELQKIVPSEGVHQG